MSRKAKAGRGTQSRKHLKKNEHEKSSDASKIRTPKTMEQAPDEIHKGPVRNRGVEESGYGNNAVDSGYVPDPGAAGTTVGGDQPNRTES